MPENPHSYLAKLRTRAKESRVYQKHQLEGLEIAKLLGDEAHKALYIKLAKTRDTQEMRGLAQDIARNDTVINKGAYFMACLYKKFPKSTTTTPRPWKKESTSLKIKRKKSS